MYVKICGVTTTEHVEVAIASGASAIGLVLVDSPRRVAPEQARALVAHAGERAACVAVFRELDERAIELALASGCTHLQARGALAAFRALPASLRPIPVIHDQDDAGAQIAALGTLDAPLLFDGTLPGTGTPASRERAFGLARRHALILAGGLDPENVAEAIARVRPFGVDVSSGVERARGQKDPDRIRAFVREARAAFSSLSEVQS